MSGKEQAFIDRAYKENSVSTFGSNITGFEEDLERYLNDKRFVAALNSGTSAIHLALILLGVKSGDEVICQSNTFVASINPVLYLGSTPILIDSEPQTWNLCPEQLEIAIKDRLSKGRKPRAIIAVHLYGMPYNVDAIQAIGSTYDIPVIEDSAEALGSSYKKRKCGTFGDFSILSFNGNKIITTAGGGALISRSQDKKKQVVFLATQAKDSAEDYTHSHPGYNYRMSNILAGIGRGQMLVLDNYVEKRRQNHRFYEDRLKGLEAIRFLAEPEGYRSNRWLSCILTESLEMRKALRSAFDRNNIQTRPLWKPMHLQPLLKDMPAFINGVSEDLFKKGLCLPSGSNLTEADRERIITCFSDTYGSF
jgi:dTDP-4-amino-4,6-dideoxygalactose transaminase